MISTEVLGALREKYATLCALRRSRDALAARGVLRLTGEARASRHAALRMLAAAFPGALRELEECPIEELERRLGVLSDQGSLAESVPGWLRAVVAYHQAWREELTAARLRPRGVGAPSGRRHDLVWKRVADHLGVELSVARALVLGSRCESESRWSTSTSRS